MAKSTKVYTLKWTRRDQERSTSGTVEELTKYFSYTLLCGHSYNPRINQHPTTIKSLISNINKSIDQTNGGYDRPYVHLSEEV